MTEQLQCPECGDTTFMRWEGGNYTERHIIDTSPRGLRHEWDKQETDVMDRQPWECASRHLQPDEIQEALEVIEI